MSEFYEMIRHTLRHNEITSHQVVMNPRLKTIQVAFDNAFAGQADLHELNTDLLLN